MSLTSRKPLTADEYYQNALNAMAMEPGPKQLDAVADIVLDIAHHRVRLSEEQALDIKARAMALFQSGNAGPLLEFTWLFILAGVLRPERGFWHPLAPEQDPYGELGCEVRLLREAGILEPGERVSAADFYFMEVGNRGAPRAGRMILTDTRLFSVGALVPPHQYMADAYRLYYDDHASKHWLYFVDYLMLDRIVAIESKWGVLNKNVFVDYQTKYIKESFHTLFGPYFLKWRLPSTLSVSEGVLKIVLSPSPGVQADRRMRQEELVKRVLEAKAKLNSGRKQTSS